MSTKKQTNINERTSSKTSETEMVPEGRKGKASSLTQVVKPKTTFRKKIGKMKEEEEQEMSRTHKNIFSWIKPSIVKEVVADEKQADVEVVERI